MDTTPTGQDTLDTIEDVFACVRAQVTEELLKELELDSDAFLRIKSGVERDILEWG